MPSHYTTTTERETCYGSALWLTLTNWAHILWTSYLWIDSILNKIVNLYKPLLLWRWLFSVLLTKLWQIIKGSVKFLTTPVENSPQYLDKVMLLLFWRFDQKIEVVLTGSQYRSATQLLAQPVLQYSTTQTVPFNTNSTLQHKQYSITQTALYNTNSTLQHK